MRATSGTVEVSGSLRVTSLLTRPERARALLLLGHGAGAGMRHAFLEGLAAGLATREIATFRYQFPYTERGGHRPDPPALLLRTVVAAAAAARAAAPRLPFFAGGKSMGGRITSMAAADGMLPGLRGLVLVGYPLHAPGAVRSVATPAGLAGSAISAPSRAGRTPDRRAHLLREPVPMLFLQGTRDRLAGIEEMRALCAEVGSSARLFEVPEADHSFHVPARSGRTDAEVLDDLCAAIADWVAAL